MISHCNVTTQCDRALQNAANSVPASAHTEVERATCAVAQLLLVSGRSGLQGPLSLASEDLGC